MKIKLDGKAVAFEQALVELQDELGFVLADDGMVLTAEQDDTAGVLVALKDGKAEISYQRPIHFFRGFGLLVQHALKGEAEFTKKETPQFDKIGPMFDLSRNAVLRVDSVKTYLRKLAIMGLDSAMLYMEDTYEVESEPYFGYMRGRYSAAELKEMDDYAYQFGIELIPCIQTLAHLEEFLKWGAVTAYKDTRGALLLESEKTYALLEDMITAATQSFRSKRIHIGMDEAEELGRGRFLNQHGYKPRFELMKHHLERVLEITDKLGLEATMWSDMFLKLASSTGDVYTSNTEIPEHIVNQTPDGIQLMYWQYNQTDKNHYTKMFKQHQAFGRTPAFAGGIWVWNTFAVNYNLSLKASEAALMACKEAGVKEVFITLWGDDGYENNPFAALLGMQYYAEHAYAETLDQEKLEERVEFCTGVTEQAFLKLQELDMPPGVEQTNTDQTNPSKFLLWQDVLLGVFDKHIEGQAVGDFYKELAGSWKDTRDANQALDYLFDVPEKLAAVLALKGDVGVKLKRAYDAKDKTEMDRIANQVLPEISVRVDALREAHRKQWLQINKPFGWEVVDIRYGGLKNRLDTATKRVNDYLAGRIHAVEELEQERLYYTPEAAESTGLGWCSYHYRIASPNVFFHVLPIC